MENAKKYLNQKTLIIAAMISGLVGFILMFRLSSSVMSLVLGVGDLSDMSSALGSVGKGLSLINFMNMMSMILLVPTIFVLANIGYQMFAENKKTKENIVFMVIYAFVTFSTFRGVQLFNAFSSLSKGNFQAVSKFASMSEGGVKFLVYSLLASYIIVYVLAIYFACYAYYKQIDLPFINQLQAKVVNATIKKTQEEVVVAKEETTVEEVPVQEEVVTEEAVVEEVPVQKEVVIEEAVVEEAPVQEEVVTEEAVVEEAPVQEEVVTEEAIVEEAPVQEEVDTEEVVVEEAPVQEEVVTEEVVVEEVPVQEKNDLTCKVCGAEIEEGQKFCSKCGANLEMQNTGGANNE